MSANVSAIADEKGRETEKSVCEKERKAWSVRKTVSVRKQVKMNKQVMKKRKVR